MESNTTLTQFGTSFQSKIITSCLLDSMFLQTIMEVLQPEYFESDANSWLAKTINEYFNKYKTTPTLEALKIEIENIENDVFKISVVEGLKDAWRYREANDLQFVQEKTLDFCKNQVLKSAIMESVNLLENQNYDGIKTVIDNAMKAGTPVDVGHDYNVGIEERLTKSTRITIKTPWDITNEIMDGGLGEGELGVVVAPAGVGKTWLLQSLAAGAIKKGFTVVHYTLDADILRDNSGMREVRHQLGAVYEELRGLAGEFKVPIWTASQANRSALEEEVIEATKVAEAYSKIMIADFVMSISRKAEDKLSHTARCHIIKNRFGIDGITYPMSMNTNLGKIEIYESTTQPGKEQQGKMDNSEEFKRKLLASKYNDMKSSEVDGFE
jgi:hypothetical protein